MAHEFSGAFGQPPDQAREISRLEAPCHLESLEIVGSAAASSDETRLADLLQKRNRRGNQAADPGDAKLGRDTRHGVENLRQQMRMLVRVEMTRLDSGVQDFAYLAGQPLVNRNAAKQDRGR